MSATNPDCAAGKHRACAGDAWDDQTDQRVDCECRCHEGHEFADEYGGCVRCGAFPGEGLCTPPRPFPPGAA